MLRPILNALLAFVFFSLPAFGMTLPELKGPVILTVTGLDPEVFPTGEVQFDLDMLKSLGAAEIATTSIWTAGRHVYTGVPLSALLTYLQIQDRTLSLHALNDYSVEMPSSEAEPLVPILAYEMDDLPMQVRDKGPIWVIYPYDTSPTYRTDTIYTRSVWQLDRIDVQP